MQVLLFFCIKTLRYSYNYICRQVHMEKQVKKSNISAEIGFLLMLLNLVVGSALLLTVSRNYLLIFVSATAGVSIILCIMGLVYAPKLGKGKILSISGITVDTVILAVAAFYIVYIFLR